MSPTGGSKPILGSIFRLGMTTGISNQGPFTLAGDTTPLMSDLPMEDDDFREIVAEFIIRLRQQLQTIRNSYPNDLGQIALMAHGIKGSGGTAGFQCLTRPSERLELLVREGRLDEIEPAILALEHLAARMTIPVSANGDGSL